MTFEDIHNAITAGNPAESIAEIESSLDILTRYGKNVKTMIAYRIAEYATFRRGEKSLWEDIRARWAFEGDKTVFHYYAAGSLLIALRDFRGEGESEKENHTLEMQVRKCFAACVELDESKLESIAVLRHKRGIVEVMNFLKLHFQKNWTLNELKAKLSELYGFGRKPANPGQLTFAFDIFGDVSPEAVADVLDKNPGPAETLQIVSNGALWCRSASQLLIHHADQFSDAALGEFERLAAELDEAKRCMDRLIAEKKRAVLALN